MKITRRKLKDLIEKTLNNHEKTFNMLIESEVHHAKDMKEDEIINSLNRFIDMGEFDHAMLILDSFPGLRHHPRLRIWSAVNYDADHEVIASSLTQEEALSIKMHDGEKVYTKGETFDKNKTAYKYYLVFPSYRQVIKSKR